MASSAKLEVSSSQPPRAVSSKKLHYPFWFGGSASCFAATVTHPLDLVKVFSCSISRCPFASGVSLVCSVALTDDSI
ncbi:hypothetical protein AWENTII_005476 [Aspergillus wentii]